MDKRKCDCGAEPYYDEPIAQGNTLCESCYVGELEAIAGTQEFYRKRVKELEAVVESARAILTCISDVDDGCALVSCGDHAADLREALAKLEEKPTCCDECGKPVTESFSSKWPPVCDECRKEE